MINELDHSHCFSGWENIVGFNNNHGIYCNKFYIHVDTHTIQLMSARIQISGFKQYGLYKCVSHINFVVASMFGYIVIFSFILYCCELTVTYMKCEKNNLVVKPDIISYDNDSSKMIILTS